MTAAAGEGADHDHHIAVCLRNQQEGAVKHKDQQKLLIIITMLHLVAFAGIDNLPPVPALTTTLPSMRTHVSCRKLSTPLSLVVLTGWKMYSHQQKAIPLSVASYLDPSHAPKSCPIVRSFQTTTTSSGVGTGAIDGQ
jgi:hypothetical protein